MKKYQHTKHSRLLILAYRIIKKRVRLYESGFKEDSKEYQRLTNRFNIVRDALAQTRLQEAI